MKILVFSHKLDVGGAQVNAIEITEALRDLHGHDVALFATPGPMVKVVEEKRLPFLPAPVTNDRPSVAMTRALSEAIRRERPDVIHVWDSSQWLVSYYAVNLFKRIPIVLTDMGSDDVPRHLPKSLPTTFGTPELVERARMAGRRRAALLLPPVDVYRNAPDAVDPRSFREHYGLKNNEIAIVTVSRLANSMKAESLRRTIETIRALGRDLPLRFFIVGDGEARVELERLASQTNNELGRVAVVLTGELLDPRLAYAAADIVIGMGGSALRGMAFAKPAIIVGVQAFSAPFTPETAESFYYKGMYGKGDGSPSNARLIADVRALCEHPDQFLALGEFSRQFVAQHFSLESVSAHLAEFCRAAVADVPQFHIAAADGLRTSLVVLGRRFVPDRLRRRVKRYELEKQRG